MQNKTTVRGREENQPTHDSLKMTLGPGIKPATNWTEGHSAHQYTNLAP